MGIHVAYLNLPSEFNNPKFIGGDGRPYIDTTQRGMGRYGPNGQDGGNAFEGGSGNDGYPSNIQAVLNLGGAIGDTTFIQNENIPSSLSTALVIILPRIKRLSFLRL